MPPPSKSVVKILDSDIRVDSETGYICITDIGNLKDGAGKVHVANWLRASTSILFFRAWEMEHNPGFKGVEFDTFRRESGNNSFRISAKQLADAGASGIFVKKGRWGGTYCNVDWTIHFANWLDPFFYVKTISALRKQSDSLYGRGRLHQRFVKEIARENASESYNLVVHGIKHSLPDKADIMVRRHFGATEADILNIAMWNMTAREWRTKTGIVDPHANMRDFATVEELKVLNALQISLRNLQEDQYTAEEKLLRLCHQANELLIHYCNTPEKAENYQEAKEKRGW
ncbi:KilA-N domain-containing protein [Neolewinella aurantiaca]|uniref:KilA-N domain-containing protein n=1 Tax=Neolewinella aurantiaca TaxID=2602767 RepID=A0A5C7FIG8_9BACT|nr:KilA-N domain-containing protein [Neolewinella aurantiaca]TXF90326.1 KilA-N domain-containing protein [Neolewinella aurantiaca]